MHCVKQLWKVLAIIIIVQSCTPDKAMETHWPLGVKYEIFVQSFADGNGDGIGDLKGLTEKLDYVQDLGVNGIWLMPIMPSPSYHKYDVTDYQGIHPDYGTLDDFRVMVAEAHRRNIKVIIDLVLNHTSKKHPWFLSACEGKNSPYRNYYVWANKDSIAEEISKKTVTLDSDNITQWHAVNRDSLAEHYYGFFSNGMPDLNFDNPKVRNEFVTIAHFWLNEMKVDGFRFDAARHIYPDDRAPDSHAFWLWYRKELEKIKPDVYLIGEVFSVDREEVVPYTHGLPSLFNFEMGKNMTDVILDGKDTLDIMSGFQEQLSFFHSVSPDFLDSPILTNHDQNRIGSELGDHVEKAKLAAAMLLMLPGAPYLYYGEELGMLGMKPDEFIREPFPWGDETHTTTWIAARYSTPEVVPTVQQQLEDEHSVLTHYKKLIAYRNSRAVLTKGNASPITGLPSEIVGLTRTFENDTLAVFHNVSDVEVTINLKGEFKDFNSVSFSTHPSSILENKVLTLAAYSTIVLAK